MVKRVAKTAWTLLQHRRLRFSSHPFKSIGSEMLSPTLQWGAGRPETTRADPENAARTTQEGQGFSREESDAPIARRSARRQVQWRPGTDRRKAARERKPAAKNAGRNLRLLAGPRRRAPAVRSGGPVARARGRGIRGREREPDTYPKTSAVLLRRGSIDPRRSGHSLKTPTF